MVGNIFLDTSLLFAITVSVAFLIRFLKQPLIVAYIIAGIVAGPIFLNLTNGGEEFFKAFAEMGVVLLLFVLGLSLNFSYIKKVGVPALVAGVGQVLFTGIVGFGIGHYILGMAAINAMYLAVALTFSSTIIIVKLLSDKHDTETVYGRYTIGLMLVQDIIAIVLMVLLTSLYNESATLLSAASALALKGMALIALAYFLTKVVLPHFLHRVAQSNEFLFIFTIAWCFGVASLVHAFGFSLEIGAVVAGITLGSSTYQFQIMSKIKPLRDFFIVLFFIILGSEMSIASLGSSIVPAIVFSLFILVGNPIILYLLFRLMRFTRRNSFLAGLTAAQVSEFGFILLFTGESVGLQLDNELVILTMVALITIFVSSYLITYNEAIYRAMKPFFNLFGHDRYRQTENMPDKKVDVWVVGYHRIGWKVCDVLKRKKVSFGIIDHNPLAVKKITSRGLTGYFGDIGDIEFLELLPLEKARLVILTISAPDDQLTCIKYIKSKSTRPIIIAHLQHTSSLQELYSAGADYVLLPHLLSGEWLSRMLATKPWTKKTFDELEQQQKEELKLKFTLRDV